MKYAFYADYSEGAHEEILKALSKFSSSQDLTYGYDKHSENARNLIREEFNLTNAFVDFVPSGTMANIVCLASLLKPYEAAIAATTGHINVHESGAIEATGHKVLSFETDDGKITKEIIDKALGTYEDEHTVIPKVIYVSQTTEVGTAYTIKELTEIINYAKQNNLFVYLDGARLAMAIASDACDFSAESFSEIAQLLDAFYIGGTKNGGLFGEAVVVNNSEAANNFRHIMKQRGAIIGKGRAIGQQFERFFAEDKLYIQTAKHAVDMSKKLYDGLKNLSIKFDHEYVSNQLFPILETRVIDELEKSYGFYRYEKIGDNLQKIRLVTSWGTPSNAIDQFIEDLNRLI
ncbi:MAG: aminotransferase class V-fold PLP-dependent enzyme [Acidimicrobiia bacterium]